MAAGEEILAYCSSCKIDLRHIIVAHKSGNTGTVAKVECKTCHKVHSYRAPKGAAGVVTAKSQHEKATKSRTKVQPIPISVEWNRQMNESTGKPTKSYTIHEAFIKGDIMQHPQFGVGIIQELKDATKVEVLFENSVRLLVHNKKA